MAGGGSLRRGKVDWLRWELGRVALHVLLKSLHYLGAGAPAGKFQ